MKYKISSKDIQRLIAESIKESISILSEDDKFAKNFKGQLEKGIGEKVKNNPYLQQAADELAINMNYNQAERDKEKNKYLQIFSGKGNNSSKKEINQKVLSVIDILRQNTTRGGSVNNENIRKESIMGKYGGLTYADIIRTKDFLDSLDLRFLYDPSVDVLKKKAISFPKGVDEVEFNLGVIVKRDGTIDLSNFDVGHVSDRYVKEYTKGRKEKYKEDASIPAARIDALANVVNKYVQSSYGINFNCPSLRLGNKKVTDAVLINFTSAFRCPGWNECLVKHACYARADEVYRYGAIKPSNDRKNLMWLSCENDPELTTLVYNFIKASIVKFSDVEKKLKELGLLANYGGDIDQIAAMKISEMDETLLGVLRDCKRVSYIRLNENGDFINQKLLEKFDEMARDFSLIGIETAAYTCRNLNYKNIKNIIINSSVANLKGPTVARYFYAIPPETYNRFDDTYEDTNITDKPDAIIKTPKPLYSMDKNGNVRPNGSYYYKCPCGRKDFKIEGFNIKKNVNCYQCQMCYNAPDESIKRLLGNKGKLFVFVEGHGSQKNVLDKDRETLVIHSVGAPESFFRDMKQPTQEKVPIKENLTGSLQDEAFNEITKNAIYSINKHFKEFLK